MANQALINSLVNLSLPSAAPEQFKTPEIRAAVDLFITVTNNLLRAFEQYGGITQKDVTLWSTILPGDTLLRQNQGRLYVVAGENLAFGDFINLYNNAGVLNARKANGAAGLVKRAMGYWNVTGGTLLGQIGEAILSQGILTIGGVVPGDLLFLSAAPGQVTTVPLIGAGQLEQFVGVGVATNLAYIDIVMGQYIQH